MATGLLAYWPCEDSAGFNAVNATGRNTMLLGSGSPGRAPGRRAGQGMAFSGSSQEATVAIDGTAMDNWTVQFWFQPRSSGTTLGVWSWYNSSIGQPFALIQSDALNLKFYADGAYRETSVTLTVGNWYHIAMSMNSITAWKYYCNGRLLSSNTLTNPPGFRVNAVTQHFGNGFSGFSNMVLDGASFHCRALTPGEILASFLNFSRPIARGRRLPVGVPSAGAAASIYPYYFGGLFAVAP